jgi:hypothetical protein
MSLSKSNGTTGVVEQLIKEEQLQQAKLTDAEGRSRKSNSAAIRLLDFVQVKANIREAEVPRKCFSRERCFETGTRNANTRLW